MGMVHGFVHEFLPCIYGDVGLFSDKKNPPSVWNEEIVLIGAFAESFCWMWCWLTCRPKRKNFMWNWRMFGGYGWRPHCVIWWCWHDSFGFCESFGLENEISVCLLVLLRKMKMYFPSQWKFCYPVWETWACIVFAQGNWEEAGLVSYSVKNHS